MDQSTLEIKVKYYSIPKFAVFKGDLISYKISIIPLKFHIFHVRPCMGKKRLPKVGGGEGDD